MNLDSWAGPRQSKHAITTYTYLNLTLFKKSPVTLSAARFPTRSQKSSQCYIIEMFTILKKPSEWDMDSHSSLDWKFWMSTVNNYASIVCEARPMKVSLLQERSSTPIIHISSTLDISAFQKQCTVFLPLQWEFLTIYLLK